MNKAITVLGLSAAAVAISVSNASAMEQATEATTTINHKDAQENATSNKVSELQTSDAVTENNVKTVTATETNTTREATSANTNSTLNNVSEFPTQETNNVKTTNGNAVATNEEATASEEVNKIDESVNTNTNNTNEDKNAANENADITNTNEDKNADTEAVKNIKTDAAVETNATEDKTPQTTTSTNLREEADVTSGKIMELKAGEKLTVLERKNGWTKVQTESGQIGWISGYYVSGDEEANKENETVKTEDKTSTEDVLNNNKTDQREKETNGKVTSTDFLNVRVGPSVSNGVSGVIYRGEIFKVLERNPNGWVKVLLNDGTTGWANGKYIDMTVEQDNTNLIDYNKEQDKQNSNQGKVNSTVGLRVRSGAGTNTSVITTLNHNSIVNIIGEENGWYKVKLENGQIGYVGAGYITKTTPSNPENNNNNNNGSGNIKEDGQNENNKPEEKPDNNASGSSKKVIGTATSLLGVKYSWGGTTTAGFDCSGFTQYVYKNALGINIPRVSRDQANAGSAVSMSNAKAGDLLYFDTMGGGRTSHVGIYLGSGKFIHASGSASNPEYVKISNLSEKWVKCLGARRFA